MYQNEDYSSPRFQRDYPLESDISKSPCHDQGPTSVYSFERSTPRLLHSDTPKSIRNNSNLYLSHFPSSGFDCKLDNRNLTGSSTHINPRIFLDVGDTNISRERSYNFLRSSQTGRSNTCNVTIPYELDERKSSFQNPLLNNQVHTIRIKSPSRYNRSLINNSKVSFYKNKNQSSKLRDLKPIRSKHTLDLESQNSMVETQDKDDLDSLISKSGRDVLLAPEFASDETTRNNLNLGREVFMAIVGCQLVYIVTSLLFGNVALSIIVTLLLIQSCFCHCDGRPLAYYVNALLSFSIGVTVIIALTQDVSGLEPFRTEPVLKTLSYVYIPICFLFTALSLGLGEGFRRLLKRERKAIINATNNLLGKDFCVDEKSLVITKK